MSSLPDENDREKMYEIGEQVVSDEEGEEEEEEEMDDGSDTWEVKAVTDIRCIKETIEFLVTWDSDGSQTWEPIKSFPSGYEHEMLQNFKAKNLKLWDTVHKQAAKSNKPKRAKWTYVADDADRYEKPDESAAGEAKRLADPNRLEDPQEKFLRTYGIEGRVSRSKVRDIKRNIDLSSEPSPQSRQPSPPKQEQAKKEKKPRGRKKNGQDGASTEKPAATPKASRSKPVRKNQRKKEAVEKNKIVEKEESGKGDDPEEMVVPRTIVKPQVQKKRAAQKLNSSDSSSEESEEEVRRPAKEKKLTKHVDTTAFDNSRTILTGRIEAGGNHRSKSPTFEANNSKPYQASTTKVDSTINDSVRSNDLQTSSFHRKRMKGRDSDLSINTEHQGLKVEYSKVVCNDHDRIEKALTEFGIKSAAQPKMPRSTEFERKRSTHEDVVALDVAIQSLDYLKVEELLKKLGPSQSYDAILRHFSLHEILSTTYQAVIDKMEGLEERQRATEDIVRLVLAYIPPDYLRVQNRVDLNTLLHCAINAGNIKIVEFLINMGSPLYICNTHAMTAVESSVVMKRSEVLEIVIKNGGTFHQLLEKKPIDGSFYYRVQQFMQSEKLAESDRLSFIKTAERMSNLMNSECYSVRSSIAGGQVYEVERGPLVCFPRGISRKEGFKQTIQFNVPEHWVDLTSANFMLVVIPMAFNEKQNRFVGSSRVPLMKTPILCGTKCDPMTKKDRTIFYHASKAITSHFRRLSRVGRRPLPCLSKLANMCENDRNRAIMENINYPFHPRVCTVSLDVDPNATLPFITCQLIRFEYTRKNVNANQKSISASNRVEGAHQRLESNNHRLDSSHLYNRPNHTTLINGHNYNSKSSTPR